MSLNKWHFPGVVAESEKFLWEVFLSKKWDRLFLENSFLILPREIAFAPWSRYLKKNIDTIPSEHGEPSEVDMIIYRDANTYFIQSEVKIKLVAEIIMDRQHYRAISIAFSFPSLNNEEWRIQKFRDDQKLISDFIDVKWNLSANNL
jgi:hypothetical protein